MTELMAACGSGLAVFLMTWGAMRGKVMDLERRTTNAEASLVQQKDLIYSLRDIYVSQQHFNEIMLTIRETHRELKDDMKKVLDLLTTAP